MWQNKLKEIIYILENSDVNEIDVSFWGRRFRVVKSAGVSVMEKPQVETTSLNAPLSDKSSELSKPISEPVDSNSKEVLSPMPGTFYSAPSPEADPFVKVGDSVKKGDTLCIIEAMKIMNEIEAESSGTISEIVINNGEPVEYNQPLFKIKPS
ncbi:MAG: acetyl-CoA carboxylase, biotin carboxyl carrier protein [Candidatus Marinimicrobia bacterium]|jgi:acetyl-CoA carboxylase biotin carboxyl carrier protein|nr:acetyl-CoA carboxylase, biotin carboxyl carrier protein [Candidatus Neomarinimicrobiota bacterium]MBO69976.1 acetyl-CoA carboxylase, biotin carboxyl carrier protein [Candidatus Neomarinimicrobiota bacterium]MEC8706142.1 acetyl-CoA carboxylase biotin carboxyl carrier protein [Candidatus Neomarinimicrobiota bacterium]|tara:strand:- start:2303 stop:2761 length:459 start_codon:yes stop_codon:yes gene_type:complete